jgi:hypothetical protein
MRTLRSALSCLLICTIAIGGAAACTSIKTIRPTTEPGKPVYGSLKKGDRVTLHLRDGRQLAVRIAQVDEQGVVSIEGIRYLREDITRLERKAVSVGKTVALAAGVGFGVLLIAGFLIASALGSILGGG